ncbi:9331_t:CDS:2 [Cetraspora pellucida]|uniref:9331_t:CDS:1 n=1 Tax=Cetraspora pellucida TaxID=1433469 RepID=A0A9N9HM49_9GLOM|nr:9331_t:CDS:2 [Cetraspora pellucida]
MPADISCLETLALNILRNSCPEKIAENADFSELDPAQNEIESGIDTTAKSQVGSAESLTQNTNDQMDISSSLFNDYQIYPSGTLLFETTTKGILLFGNMTKKIDHAESRNEVTNREVINSYFYFGGVIYKRYKEYKKSNGKQASDALVFDNVRKQIPEGCPMSLCGRKWKEPEKSINSL